MVAVKDDGHRDGYTSWLTMYFRTGILLKRSLNGLVSGKEKKEKNKEPFSLGFRYLFLADTMLWEQA